MGKISKLILAGLGVYAYKYYSKKPDKIEEHKNLAKEKVKNTFEYSKKVWENAKNEGLSSSAENVKNDLEDVIVKNKEIVTDKINNTIELGKKLADNTSDIISNVNETREKGIELSFNLAESKKIIKEDITPRVEKYIDETKNIIGNLSEKVTNLKENIEKEKINEKIKEFKNKLDDSINNTKETIKDITKKDN